MMWQSVINLQWSLPGLKHFERDRRAADELLPMIVVDEATSPFTPCPLGLVASSTTGKSSFAARLMVNSRFSVKRGHVAPVDNRETHARGRIMRFGEFLILKGKISQSDVLRAIEIQSRLRPFAPSLCVELRLLDTTTALRLSAEAQELGRTFLWHAYDQGVLSHIEYKQAEAEIRRRGRRIGEVLVDMGAIDGADLPQCITDYLRHQDQPPLKVAVPMVAPHTGMSI